jgi:hypothetical protein
VVILRSVTSRMVLQHDRRRAERCLDAAHEALGRAAALRGQGAPGSRPAPSGEIGLPWSERLGVEARGFFTAVWAQLHSHLFPKAPALVGMVVGWWIANTYTDSHVRSVLRSVGVGSGGTHVVSGSTYRSGAVRVSGRAGVGTSGGAKGVGPRALGGAGPLTFRCGA